MSDNLGTYLIRILTFLPILLFGSALWADRPAGAQAGAEYYQQLAQHYQELVDKHEAADQRIEKAKADVKAKTTAKNAAKTAYDTAKAAYDSATKEDKPAKKGPMDTAKTKLDNAEAALKTAETEQTNAEKAKKELDDTFGTKEENEAKRDQALAAIPQHDPSQHGGGSGGGEEKKQQPPPPPPPPPSESKDDSPPPENTPVPQQTNQEKPQEVKKPEDNFEGQLADLNTAEEIPDPEPFEPIEIPTLDFEVPTPETPTLATDPVSVPVPTPIAEKSTPSSVSLTVDEDATPGGENAAVVGSNVFTGLGGRGADGESPLIATGYTGTAEDEDGHRGVRSITEAMSGGGGGGDSKVEPAGSMGLDLSSFLGGGGTISMSGGGGPLGVIEQGPKAKVEKQKDLTKLPLKLKMFLVLNNQRVLGSTRKFRNRLLLEGSQRKLKEGQVPDGFYNRVGQNLSGKGPIASPVKVSSTVVKASKKPKK